MAITIIKELPEGPLRLKATVLVPISAKLISDSLKPIFYQLFNYFQPIILPQTIATIFFFGLEPFPESDFEDFDFQDFEF
jgi:hypothetical protein